MRPRSLLVPLCLLLSACAGPSQTPLRVARPDAETAVVVTALRATRRPSITSPTTAVTPAPQPSPTPSPALTPSPTAEPAPTVALPPMLAWDYYPHGITHAALVARLPEATTKSGRIAADETWSGVIHMTGDVEVLPGATLILSPGTLVLVAARNDDRRQGPFKTAEPMNPKDPPIDHSQRTTLNVQGALEVVGTAAEPVILTSDAVEPRNDDWDGIGFGHGAHGEITRAIVEFQIQISINATDVMIRQSILRNMAGCVNVGTCGQQMSPEELAREMAAFQPTLTQNHIYNTGRHAVTIRFGSPIITHNVIRARPDMEATGWEQGATGGDPTACPVVHHNYLDGSPPRLYQGEALGRYHEYTEPSGFNHMAICPLRLEYNTIVGSPHAVWGPVSRWSMQHNNVLAVPAVGPAAEHGNRDTLALSIEDRRVQFHDGRILAFMEQFGQVPKAEAVTATHNYWGTTDPREIEALLRSRDLDVRIEWQPFATSFILEALPNWHEFAW